MTEPAILILEADVLVRHPLAEYLRECGYRVIGVSNPDEAREVLADPSFSVDIVLADIDSGGGDGFAFGRWVRVNRPGVEVVLTATVVKTTEQAAEICAEGPAPARPYDHRLLLERIRRLRATRDRATHR